MPGVENKRRRRRRDRSRRWFDDLIEDEEDPIRVVAERVLETPQAQGIIEGLKELLDRAGNAIDPRYRPPPERPPPRWGQPRQRLAPDPLLIARAVLHFGLDEPLTTKKIQERRRALALVCHPDKGGSTEAMAKLNNAADLLLAAIK